MRFWPLESYRDLSFISHESHSSNAKLGLCLAAAQWVFRQIRVRRLETIST